MSQNIVLLSVFCSTNTVVMIITVWGGCVCVCVCVCVRACMRACVCVLREEGWVGVRGWNEWGIK